ncbi:MAG: SusD/RagB family nutrient-binding outer membrane lipoprotein [Mangrovibacterium sp.]
MKHLYSILLSTILLVAVSGCTDEDFDSQYADPSKTSTVSCEKLMTGIFKTAFNYTMPSTDRYFSFETQQIGRYAQTIGFINGKGMYLGMGDNYNNDRWKNFYNVLTQFRLLEKTYNSLSEAEKANYEVTIWLSKIFVYEQLQQIIDLWGDVPFSEAGYLASTSDVASSYASYDSASELYKMMLDDLKAINTSLASYSPSSFTSTYLTAQDYINNGDLAMWRKYANSLRLRIAMRATNGTISTEAKAAIKEMLENASTYPMVDSNAESIQIEADEDGFKIEDKIMNGFESWGGQCNRASSMMISVLTGDPRLEILYDPNSDGDYFGIDPEDSESVQDANFTARYYAAVDTATLSRNPDFPGILMTAAEVSFTKAEAYQKAYASGDAEAAFKLGVTQSIEYYYGMNATGTYRTPLDAPTSTEVADFAAAKWSAYDSEEEAIATQKWLHFSLIQMVQAWAEVRRTGYPVLYFQTDNMTSDCSEVPVRLRYPADERDNNTAKYNEATNNGATNTYYVKLFWAK